MRKTCFLALLILLTLAAFPVLAQSATATPAAPEAVVGYEYPTLDLSAITALLSNTVSGLVLAAFGAAPVTTVLVNFLKNLPALRHIPAPRITVAVASVLYLLAIVASTTGLTVQFRSLLDFISTSAPAFVSFIATLFAAPAIYNAASARDVSLVGTPRKV